MYKHPLRLLVRIPTRRDEARTHRFRTWLRLPRTSRLIWEMDLYV